MGHTLFTIASVAAITTILAAAVFAADLGSADHRTTITECATGPTSTEGSAKCSPPSVTYSGVQPPCVIQGQPAGAYLRIVSDSGAVLLTGAIVKAVHEPASQVCEGGYGSKATTYIAAATTNTFTTNGTEWIPLDTFNAGKYTYIVEYSGQTYILTAALGPLSVTCSTLYVPSGRTNNTITYLKSNCK